MSAIWWALLIALFIIGVVLDLPLLLLLCFLLGLIQGAAWLWQRHCLDAVSYRRRLGVTRLFFGEETDLYVEMTNAKPLPLFWLRVEDEFPTALEIEPAHAVRPFRPGQRMLVNLLSMRWYERVTRRYRVRGMQRGVWRIGPATLASGDLFGFAVNRRRVEASDALLVYPKLLPLSALGLPALRPFGELQTGRRLVEDPLRLMGARPYAPGDSYRHIHWKATAHRRELQSKVFDPSAARPVAVFINVNTSRYLFEGTDYDLREYAISAGASIAAWVCEHGQPAGVYANAVMQPGAQRVRVRPRSHPDQLAEILDALARVTGYGRWPLEALLGEEARRLPYGAAIVVVSATVTDELLAAMLDLQTRGGTATLVTLGEVEQALVPADIRRYHIGGKQEWNDLATLALA